MGIMNIDQAQHEYDNREDPRLLVDDDEDQEEYTKEESDADDDFWEDC